VFCAEYGKKVNISGCRVKMFNNSKAEAEEWGARSGLSKLTC
jgi:hypothetical protein